VSITREEGIELLNRYIHNERMVAHCVATERVMKALAKRLGKDEDQWGLAGLLHDLDIEMVSGDLKRHGLETERILKETSVDPEVIDAVVMHNEVVRGVRRHSQFQHALAAAETITGLIVATALVHPDKRLAGVKSGSVVKRIKEKGFAASVSRDNIAECELIGIPQDEFAVICLEAMQSISDALGL